MSVRSLSRRLERTAQGGPWVVATNLRAYVAFVADCHALPVTELLAETEAILARARKAARGRTGLDLAGWLAAENGWAPEVIQAEAEASLAAWREQQR